MNKIRVHNNFKCTGENNDSVPRNNNWCQGPNKVGVYDR